MSELIRFSFPLNQRVQAFLQLRDGLRCLRQADDSDQAYLWLQAAVDLRTSLLGDQGKKPALAEVTGLYVSMRTHLEQLAKEHPRFGDAIAASCTEIDQYVRMLNDGIEPAVRLLSTDALITAYFNALKKHDWLGHKLALPQGLSVLWEEDNQRRETLFKHLEGLHAAINSLDRMLQDYVIWDRRIAREGSDQIAPERGKNFGLLIIGLDRAMARQGIIPHVSGNRFAIRVRFQQWPAGIEAIRVEEDVPYAMMLVPSA